MRVLDNNGDAGLDRVSKATETPLPCAKAHDPSGAATRASRYLAEKKDAQALLVYARGATMLAVSRLPSHDADLPHLSFNSIALLDTALRRYIKSLSVVCERIRDDRVSTGHQIALASTVNCLGDALSVVEDEALWAGLDQAKLALSGGLGQPTVADAFPRRLAEMLGHLRPVVDTAAELLSSASGNLAVTEIMDLYSRTSAAQLALSRALRNSEDAADITRAKTRLNHAVAHLVRATERRDRYRSLATAHTDLHFALVNGADFDVCAQMSGSMVTWLGAPA